MRVLFVDDNDDLRSMMGLLLERHGHEVQTADSALQALEIAPHWQPHIVVSDIGMPGIDGYVLMERMRADSRLAPFRALALSGFGTTVDETRATAAGYEHCLTKPLEFDSFFELLRSFEADAPA